MRIRLRSLTLRIDWLMLLFPVMAMLLDCGRQTALLFLSLSLHEFAHWLAAGMLHVRMTSIRLTPFGGLAQLENPYSISASQLCAISAAGPAINCLIVLIATFMMQWTPFPGTLWLDLIAINALLMLFNLLPALPLDGGRILYAVLSRFLSSGTALGICIWSGRILAIFLCWLALAGLILYGKLNLSFLFAAVFILTSSSDERRALSDSKLHTLINAVRPITGPIPADVIAINAACTPQTALRAARPGRVTLFAIYENGRLREITDDRTLLQKLLSETSTPPIP